MEGQGISKGTESSVFIKTPRRKYAWLECIAARKGRGNETHACIGKGSPFSFGTGPCPYLSRQHADTTFKMRDGD